MQHSLASEGWVVYLYVHAPHSSHPLMGAWMVSTICFLFLILKFVNMRICVTEREGETDILHLLVHSPNGHDGWKENHSPRMAAAWPVQALLGAWAAVVRNACHGLEGHVIPPLHPTLACLQSGQGLH